MGNETYDRYIPVAEKIHDLMKEGIHLDSEKLATNLLKWIGWKNDKELEEFMDNYYPDLLQNLESFESEENNGA
jgi:hypothetical protein|tara:strand:- start:214 stop:435 length:222 start_codon:yes stop_codon:yes gene_type:complete